MTAISTFSPTTVFRTLTHIQLICWMTCRTVAIEFQTHARNFRAPKNSTGPIDYSFRLQIVYYVRPTTPPETARVGIVSSWRKSWVKKNRDKAWDRELYHSWVVAPVKNEGTRKGRTLIIYDKARLWSYMIIMQTWRKQAQTKVVVAWTVWKEYLWRWLFGMAETMLSAPRTDA